MDIDKWPEMDRNEVNATPLSTRTYLVIFFRTKWTPPATPLWLCLPETCDIFQNKVNTTPLSRVYGDIFQNKVNATPLCLPVSCDIFNFRCLFVCLWISSDEKFYSSVTKKLLTCS
jgi:hypothetical protein